MSAVTTDYREKVNTNTLYGGAFNDYRLLMYFVDVVQNFFSDPINIKDERLQSLLKLGTESSFGKNIIIGPPFDPDMRESCTTPSIRIGVGEVAFSNTLKNKLPAISPAGWNSMGKLEHTEQMNISIAIITENYAGTVLLSGILKDFFLVNALNISRDSGMLTDLTVAGIAAPEHLAIASAGNAKDAFQRVIAIKATGTYVHTIDIQGPVFKGVHVTNNIK